MIDYILKGGVSQHSNFFTTEKFHSIKKDLKSLEWSEQYQPYSIGQYGNRLQAMPCYQCNYDKENDYIISNIEKILQTKITDFKVLVRKILSSEIKQSPQNFGKYGFVHRDYPKESYKEPLLAGMMYFYQAYDGGTAFFHTQIEKVPDIYISALPNRLVLYHGGKYHSPCFDYTFEERITFSFFFKLKKEENEKNDV